MFREYSVLKFMVSRYGYILMYNYIFFIICSWLVLVFYLGKNIIECYDYIYKCDKILLWLCFWLIGKNKFKWGYCRRRRGRRRRGGGGGFKNFVY